MRVNEAIQPLIVFVWLFFMMLAGVLWMLAIMLDGYYLMAFCAFAYCFARTMKEASR